MLDLALIALIIVEENTMVMFVSQKNARKRKNIYIIKENTKKNVFSIMEIIKYILFYFLLCWLTKRDSFYVTFLPLFLTIFYPVYVLCE